VVWDYELAGLNDDDYDWEFLSLQHVDAIVQSVNKGMRWQALRDAQAQIIS